MYYMIQNNPSFRLKILSKKATIVMVHITEW